MALDRRRALMTAALGFLQLREQLPEVAAAPVARLVGGPWGAVVDGMVRQGFDVALTRNGDAGWRALFYPASFIHEARAGSAWGTTPWKAVQDAAWQTLDWPPRRVIGRPSP